MTRPAISRASFADKIDRLRCLPLRPGGRGTLIGEGGEAHVDVLPHQFENLPQVVLLVRAVEGRWIDGRLGRLDYGQRFRLALPCEKRCRNHQDRLGLAKGRLAKVLMGVVIERHWRELASDRLDDTICD